MAAYQSGLRTCRNFIVMRHGGVANRAGSQFIAKAKYSTKPTYLGKFVFNDDQTYLIEAGDGYFRFYREGGQVVSSPGVPYEVATPYAVADIPKLKGFQSGDVVVLVHPSYVPQQLKRFGDTNWTLSPFTTQPSIAAPINLTGLGTGTSLTYRYLVTAGAQTTYEESLRSAVVDVPCDPPTAGSPNVLGWTAVVGAVEYYVYCDQVGNGVFGFVGTASSNSFSDIGYVPDLSSTPPIEQTLFAATGDYPTTGAFFQQRAWFAGSNNNPAKVNVSRIGLFNNFTVHSPIQDDDAVSFTLQSRLVSAVRHIVEVGKLLILTSTGEYSLLGDWSQNGAITPTAINPFQHGYNGAADITPAIVGSTILYVQARGQIVRSLAFDFESQAYTGRDITILSQHLFDAFHLTRMDFAQTPQSIAWLIRDDGTLLGLTYVPDQQVCAWHRHDTGDGDKYEDVCIVPESDQDATYVVVNRRGQRYIERFPRRWVLDTLTNCAFVDSYLTYNGTPVQQISGLDHLEGRTVNILADGNVLAQQIVRNGSLTLDRPYSVILVGLPITCDMETLDMDIAGLPQPVRGAKKLITSVSVVIDSSRGVLVGPDADNLNEYKADPPQLYGQAPALISDTIDIPIAATWQASGRLFLRHTDPLPLTVLAVIPQGSIGG